jgi:hypothetical protein
MRLTPEQHDSVVPHVKTIANWLAAVLGIGTFAGLVNVLVGLLSASWLAYQLYVAIVYELPIKRARLAAIRAGRKDPDPTDQAPLA